MKYYPLLMNVEGKECLVVGAGAVAARKARSLLECGAAVTVIGENPVPSLEKLEGRGVKIRRRKYRRSDMKRYALVFGATDDVETNRRLSRESRRLGLPVNIADDPAQSTFILPAVYRRGDLTISVSTAGRSPAAARAVKEDLGRRYGADYAALVELLGDHREMMMESVTGHRRRAALWKRILDDDLLDVVRERGRKEAACRVRDCIRRESEKGEA